MQADLGRTSFCVEFCLSHPSDRVVPAESLNGDRDETRSGKSRSSSLHPPNPAGIEYESCFVLSRFILYIFYILYILYSFFIGNSL